MIKKYIVLTVLFCLSERVYSQSGERFSFNNDLPHNQISIDLSSQVDTIIIPFEMRFSKNLCLNFIDLPKENNYYEFQNNGEVILENDSPFIVTRRNHEHFKLNFLPSDCQWISSRIDFGYTFEGELFTEGFVMRGYRKIFSSGNIKNDSIYFVSQETACNNWVLFDSQGTITSLTITKDGSVVSDRGYFSTELIELDLEKYGPGIYRIHYKPHFQEYNFEISYQ